MSYFKDIEERVARWETNQLVRFMPELPILMRLDGSSFSTFTQGLKRPYDQRLTDLMIETAKFVVNLTNARLGLVGSDEITILLYEEDINSQTIYNGRYEKLLSEIPAQVSVFFNKELTKYLPEKVDKSPYFDAKAWQVPTLEEAFNCFWVREESITRNAITMAALSEYSHKQLEGVSGSQKQEMLFQKGINFNDYPVSFKRGVFLQRRKELKKFTTEEIEKLPIKHLARTNPDLMIERKSIQVLEFPMLKTIKNKTGILLGEEPIV
jgi:tRNA(His) 5'-end guanylyltransferase